MTYRLSVAVGDPRHLRRSATPTDLLQEQVDWYAAPDRLAEARTPGTTLWRRVNARWAGSGLLDQLRQVPSLVAKRRARGLSEAVRSATVERMTVGFSGEVAEYYAQYRRGYPPEVLDALQAALLLTAEDAVLDLGCGTGQLAVPLASRVGSVIGMDPEPDMLRLARQAAARRGVRNVTWVLGADTEVPALGGLVGPRSLGMIVIGQALHWMRHKELFQTLFPLCRQGGGVAVVANGVPLWLQNSAWSRALRSCLEDYFGTRLEATCGTGTDDRRRYAQGLQAAGFADVREEVLDYGNELGFDEVIGSVCSAIPAGRLPGPKERPAFAERIRRALPPGPYRESVRVATLVGRVT